MGRIADILLPWPDDGKGYRFGKSESEARVVICIHCARKVLPQSTPGSTSVTLATITALTTPDAAIVNAVATNVIDVLVGH